MYKLLKHKLLLLTPSRISKTSPQSETKRIYQIIPLMSVSEVLVTQKRLS